MTSVSERKILKAEQVGLHYANKGKVAANIIEHINLVLEPGEVLAIQGPNGSGKSTLMKGLARQLKPSAGTISLDGQNIWNMSIVDFARQVAYVPQSLETPHDMTVNELVRLGRNPHQSWWSNQLSKADIATIDSALERCGLTRLGTKKLNELSGGEKQRALIAMALAQEPHFILMDEPTANLDFRYQLEVISIIKELKEQKIGIATILHDLNLSARIADQIALIGPPPSASASSIVALGTPQEVLKEDLLRAVFDVELAFVHDEKSNLDLYVPISISK
ncbi:ABC transporter ATP-binding protein [bacterium]|nr:ABC transporter ATP-binding protein [bacterium]MBP9810139.1 ABC transporter ATP-binding protein [bacterium]